MTYKILLDDGTEVGHYRSTKSPGQVAKAVIKTIYVQNGLKGTYRKDVTFINNRTHRTYTYDTKIEPLANPIVKKIGNNTFVERYRIDVKRI